MPLSTEERDELRSTARTLLERESSTERVRTIVAESPGFDPGLWAQMVELGWTTVHLAEEVGGAGCGYADLAVLIHELGRAITPSPFLASAVLASGALSLADEAAAGERLRGLASGELTGTVALASANGSHEHARLTARWRSEGRSVRLSGTSGFVLDADVADFVVVAARDDDGAVALIDVDTSTPGLHIERTPTVDETRRLFSVTFDDIGVDETRLLCEPGPAGAELAQRVQAIGLIAAASDACGVAEKVLERSARYAKERTQFGTPIGAFGPVKHRCADMAIAVKASAAGVTAAMEALDGPPSAWSIAAAICSSYVGPACSEACGLGLLVHGGIGFTWEEDSHLYLKRAKLDEVLFGTPSSQRRRLADTVFPTLVTT